MKDFYTILIIILGIVTLAMAGSAITIHYQKQQADSFDVEIVQPVKYKCMEIK